MSDDEVAGTIVTGVYCGPTAIVLAEGGAAGPGDTITVDSRGEDAHLLPLIAVKRVRDVKMAKPKARRQAPAGSKS